MLRRLPLYPWLIGLLFIFVYLSWAKWGLKAFVAIRFVAKIWESLQQRVIFMPITVYRCEYL